MATAFTIAHAVLSRLSDVLDCKTDAALAEKLGASRQTLSNSRSRGSIPYEKIVATAIREELSLDYIFSGRGPIFALDIATFTAILADNSVLEDMLNWQKHAMSHTFLYQRLTVLKMLDNNNKSNAVSQLDDIQSYMSKIEEEVKALESQLAEDVKSIKKEVPVGDISDGTGVELFPSTAQELQEEFGSGLEQAKGKEVQEKLLIEELKAVAERFELEFNPEELLKNGNQDSEYSKIPRYNITASGGNCIINEDAEDTTGDRAGDIAFRADFLTARGLASENLVAIKVKGDSMSPLIKDGNTMLVDTAQTSLNNGRIYVLRMDGELIVQRIQLGYETFTLLSENSDIYKPISVPKAGIGDYIEVVGRVVWSDREH